MNRDKNGEPARTLIEPLQWCHRIVSVGYITVGLIVLAHALWFAAAKIVQADLPDIYVRDFILLPAVGLLSLNVLADRMMRSSRISLLVKEFISLSLFIIDAFYLSLTHQVASILFCSFILPIFASTIFFELTVTRWTLWMSNVALLIVGANRFLAGERDSAKAMQLFVAFFMFACAYLLAKLMIQSGQDHFAALVQSDNRQWMLQQQLQLDAFTGLNNRKTFDSELARLWQEGRRTGRQLTLAMIDIDHFKSVNDVFGHAAGDRVILNFSRIIKGIQSEGIRAFRMGGDEFAILLADCDAREAYQVFEGMRNQIKSASLRESDNHVVTFSCGLACLVPDGQSPELLVTAADAALYHAKSNGRNQISICDETMQVAASGQFS